MGIPTPIARRPRRRARAGLTLVELMLGMVVLVVSVGSTMGALNAFVKLEDSNRETAEAHFALRRTLERLRNVPFDQVYASFNATPADDPPGLVDGGPAFAVPELELREGDPDGLVGSDPVSRQPDRDRGGPGLRPAPGPERRRHPGRR